MSPKSSGNPGNSGKKRKASEERRARIEAAKAAERARARRSKLIIGTVVGVVIILIGVGVAFAVGQHQHDVASKKAVAAAQEKAFIGTVTSLPVATYNTVGVGSTTASTAPTPVAGGAAMNEGGKPRILYVGGEFCPFCGMERWSLVAALSRFGTWNGLAGGVSSANDNPSNIPTFTFRDATYSSQYISLKTYETTDRDQQPLQQLSKDDTAIVTKLNPQGGIPFIDYGGLYTQNAPSYDGSFLSEQTGQQVADQLKTPTSQTAKGIIGGANVTTAQICVLTKGQPGNVCSSPGVVAAAKTLKSSNTSGAGSTPPGPAPSTPATSTPGLPTSTRS